MARIFAACLGLFGLFNCALGFIHPEWDANGWWIDLRIMPDLLARILVMVLCGLLFTNALWPAPESTRRLASIAAALSLALFCFCNGTEYLFLLNGGRIKSGLPIPLSFISMSLLVWIAWSFLRSATVAAPHLLWKLSAIVISLIAFPLAQMYFFGKTNYSRAADAALVFGARAYADGRPSQALYDRVVTACELQRTGIVKVLIFSGGPGDGAFHETDVMRNIALLRGVPAEAIIQDTNGLNTRLSLKNLRSLNGTLRVLAVSHFYHLPRVKLEAQRLGIEVRTVPAVETYTLTQMPFLIAREVAALWKYYLLPPA